MHRTSIQLLSLWRHANSRYSVILLIGMSLKLVIIELACSYRTGFGTTVQSVRIFIFYFCRSFNIAISIHGRTMRREKEPKRRLHYL